MIEGSTNDGQPLVQVSAQVMTRDDSTGGWVPLGGGGLSRVRLCKLIPVSPTSINVDGHCGSNNHHNNNNNNNISGHGAGIGQSHSQQHSQHQQLSPGDDAFDKQLKPEYIILGQRIADNSVILHCSLKEDIQYTKANPKWHHWKTDEKRFGLSFERSEDAKAFEEAIRGAVADLVEGMSDEISRLDGDERIFQCMELPLVRKDSSSHSASTTSTTTSSPGTNSPQSPLNNNDPFSFPQAKHPHRVHYLSQRVPVRNVSQPNSGIGGGSNNNGLTPQHHNPHHLYPHQQHQTLILQHDQHQKRQVQLHLHPVHQHPHYQDPQQLFYYQHHRPSSPLSEKSSVHKSSFDCSSGHEEIWVRSSYRHPQQHEPSSIGNKSDQGLLDCESNNGLGGDPDHRDLYKDQSYVVFNKNKAGAPPPPHDHDYSYPNLEPAQKPPAQRSSTKKQALPSGHHHLRSTPSSHPPLPMKNKPRSKGGGSALSGDSGGSSRAGSGGGSNGPPGSRSLLSPSSSSRVQQCKHCREVFSVDSNGRGSCEDAPDSVERCIECVSCVSCFSCLMYHCLADADGEYLHPCSCSSGDPNHCKRWTALSFLSFLFPCLWCYPPLKACHYCGTQCGLCGGRHKAA